MSPQVHDLLGVSPAEWLGGVPPRRVMLDIAESTTMADPERAQKVMTELQNWGLELALDDFGAGHSSLSRLATFPVNT